MYILKDSPKFEYLFTYAIIAKIGVDVKGVCYKGQNHNFMNDGKTNQYYEEVESAVANIIAFCQEFMSK